MLVSIGVLQDTGQQNPIQLPVRFRVEVLRIGTETLANECVQPQICVRLMRCGRFYRATRKIREKTGQQNRASGLEQGLLEDALQLADVARPRGVAQSV